MTTLKYFNKYLLSLSFVFLCVLCFHYNNVFAQGVNNAVSTESENIDVDAENGKYPEVYVTKINLDKKSFKAGDIVRGSIEFFNGSKVDIGSFFYTSYVAADFDEMGNAFTIFDSQRTGSFSIRAKETKVINFERKIPLNATGKDIRIQIWAELPEGTTMGWATSDVIEVSGGVETLKTKAGYVTLDIGDGKTADFELQNGVPLYKDKNPKTGKVVYKFSNPSSSIMNLVPEVKIFEDNASTGKLKQSFTLSSVTIKPKSGYDFSFDLPLFGYTPGVYEGVLDLKDENGVSRNMYLPFRYVIQGASAKIDSITSSVSSVKKDQNFSVTVFITGEPFDIFFERKSTEQDLSISVDITDKDKNLVAHSDAEGKVKGSFELTIPLVAERNAEGLSALVIVKDKTGQELARYDEVLSLPTPLNLSWYEKNQTLIFLILGSLFAILCTIIVVRTRNKMAPKILMFVLISFVSFPLVILAQYQGTTSGDANAVAETGLSITFSSPTTDQVFAPGQQMTVSGNAKFNACSNRNGTSDNYITNDKTKRLASWIYVKGNGWTYNGTHTVGSYTNIVSKNFFASTTPGNYKAAIKTSVNATAVSGGIARGTFTVTRTAYQPYRVAAPVNGVCNPALNGHILTSEPDISSVFCTSGTDARNTHHIEGNMYYWVCNPQYGGTMAECSLTIQACPSGQLSCNGTCVTGTSCPVDQCTNIEGLQSVVPSGYLRDDLGACNPRCGSGVYCETMDTCIPSGGTCPVDQCTNVEGLQLVIPSGYTRNTDGTCSTICPAGQVNCNGTCVTGTSCPVDECPNIAGTQSVVPEGFVKDTTGDCVCSGSSCSQDLCPNITGTQIVLPQGYTLDNGNCVCSGSGCTVCPTGQQSCNGQCISNSLTCCAAGASECNGQCISQGTTCCAAGTRSCNGQCIPEGQACCGVGQQSCNGQCIPNGEACCSANSKSCNGQCIPDGAICCGAGTYFCDTQQKCIADSASCNTSNTTHRSDSDIVNPEIPVESVAEVTFKKTTLSVNPPIVNKGYTCTISWSDLFSSYDENTECTFTGPNISSTFLPSDRTVNTSTTTRVTSDTTFKMICGQKDATGVVTNTKKAEGVCRVNINYVEVN